ncbi:hypothetical protein FB45DRAFT_888352 [Roridomyces roridus]|uniref:MARVEL domain-containing protein n=1 Tax=Roridomyces roridus TaxID=1738132 RepID=A0AAD7CJT8_9AGAR|nr:hypothetical protein FB45DRAFT_888352 [Roridomyces roridus]
MSLLDTIKDGISRVLPASNRNSIPPPTNLGIGNQGAGHANFQDDMIVSKPMIVFHTSQIFFNFLAMCCFASVAAFQAKWKIGPSGLTGFALFLSIVGMFLPLFMLLVPVAYEKYDKVIRLARALKEVRVGFILTGTGSAFSLLIAFATTISAFTQPGCKNADNDPHASLGDDFKKGLGGWCSTKKAGAIFFWGAFVFWGASLVLLVLDWRSGKLHAHTARDPPFTHPQQEATDYEMEYDPDEDDYQHVPPVRRGNETSSPAPYDPEAAKGPNPFSDANRYSAPSNPPPAQGRPSIDAYGAFNDPTPSGYSPAAPAARFNDGPPSIPEQDLGPRIGVSRTMQYADPYAAVRATIGGSPPQPDSGYQGYR